MPNTTDTTDTQATIAPSGAWIDRHNGAYKVAHTVLLRECDYGFCDSAADGVFVSGYECRPMCHEHGSWAERHAGHRVGTFVLA